MRSRGALLAALLMAALLAGCSARPSVSYQEVKGPDSSGAIKFNLTKSILRLAHPVDSQGKPDQSRIVASIETVPDTGRLYAITPQTSGGVETELQVTYQDNTRVIKTLGSEVKDHRLEIVKAVGAVAMLNMLVSDAGFKLLKEPAETIGIDPCARLPIRIDLEAYKWLAKLTGRPLDSPRGLKIPNAGGCTVALQFEEFPLDAVPTADFFRQRSGELLGVLPCSACRGMQVTIRCPVSGDERCPKTETFQLIMADPQRVQSVTIPAKGTIKMHTICGADLVSQKAEGAGAAEIIRETATQIKAVIEAQPK